MEITLAVFLPYHGTLDLCLRQNQCCSTHDLLPEYGARARSDRSISSSCSPPAMHLSWSFLPTWLSQWIDTHRSLPREYVLLYGLWKLKDETTSRGDHAHNLNLLDDVELLGRSHLCVYRVHFTNNRGRVTI